MLDNHYLKSYYLVVNNFFVWLRACQNCRIYVLVFYHCDEKNQKCTSSLNVNMPSGEGRTGWSISAVFVRGSNWPEAVLELLATVVSCVVMIYNLINTYVYLAKQLLLVIHQHVWMLTKWKLHDHPHSWAGTRMKVLNMSTFGHQQAIFFIWFSS